MVDIMIFHGRIHSVLLLSVRIIFFSKFLYMIDKNLLISAPVFTMIDFLYLTTSSSYFNDLINKIQGSNIKLRILPTIICYFFLLFGLNHFILSKNKSPDEAFLLGVVIYGVYETTNYAIIENWSPKAVIMDTIWGGILFYLTAYFTYNLKERKTVTVLRYVMNYVFNLLIYGSPPTMALNPTKMN